MEAGAWTACPKKTGRMEVQSPRRLSPRGAVRGRGDPSNRRVEGRSQRATLRIVGGKRAQRGTYRTLLYPPPTESSPLSSCLVQRLTTRLENVDALPHGEADVRSVSTTHSRTHAFTLSKISPTPAATSTALPARSPCGSSSDRSRSHSHCSLLGSVFVRG